MTDTTALYFHVRTRTGRRAHLAPRSAYRDAPQDYALCGIGADWRDEVSREWVPAEDGEALCRTCLKRARLAEGTREERR